MKVVKEIKRLRGMWTPLLTDYSDHMEEPYGIRKIIFLALMTSVALILSLIDRIPIIPAIPGAKIGLASIVTIIVILKFGIKDALIVTILRCVLAWVFHGSPIALVLSLSGGIASAFVMYFFFKGYPRYFSIPAISIAGAVTHNLAQITAAYFIINTAYIFSLIPYLMLVAVISGFCIGVVSRLIWKRLFSHLSSVSHG